MENINEKPIEDNEEIEEVVESKDEEIEDNEPMEKPKTGRHKRTPAQLESLKKAQQTRRENIAKRKKELEEIGKSTLKKQTKSKPIDIPNNDESDDEPVIVKKKKSRKPKIVLEESSDDDNEIVISRRRRKPAQKQDTEKKQKVKEVEEVEEEEEIDEDVEKPKPKSKPKNQTNVIPPEEYYSNRDILRAYGL